MQKFFPFVFITLIASCASAGTLQFVLDETGPGGAPAVVNPAITGGVGDTGSLYIWVDVVYLGRH